MDNHSKFDDEMKKAMIKRALGYDYEEKEIIAGKSGKPEKIKVTKKHVPPDLKTIERIRYLQSIGKW